MKKTRHKIERALFGLSVVGAVLLAGGIYLGIEGTRAAQEIKGVEHSQAAVIAQLQAFSLVEREIGYTRFIHNFKNGVLRRDPAKLHEAKANLQAAHQALQQLIDLNAVLRPDVNLLEKTLDRYHANASLAVRLIAEGLSPSEIDARVKIDDTPASGALVRLAAAIDRERLALHDRFKDQVAERSTRAGLDVLAALILSVVAIVLVWIQVMVRRQLRTLGAAQAALTRIEAGLDDNPKEVPALHGEPDIEDLIETMSLRIESLTNDLRGKAESLSSANEELERFAYVASHDLQEPLRKIQMNIDLIRRRDGALPADLQERTDRIVRAAGQMRTLIHDLLEFSRRGTQAFDATAIDLRRLVDEAGEEVLGEDAPAVLANNLPEGGNVTGDRAMLFQVFKNLFENSVKYAREGVDLKIDVRGSSDRAWRSVTFTDNGIGFAPENAKEIFQPFKRLHGRGAYTGSGIGLSIVKRVITRHGGTVAATGKPGVGATFVIYLPSAPAETADDREPKINNNQEEDHARTKDGTYG